MLSTVSGCLCSLPFSPGRLHLSLGLRGAFPYLGQFAAMALGLGFR